MALTRVYPLGTTQHFFNDSGSDLVAVMAVLLAGTVTSIPDTMTTRFDLIDAGYEVDTSGGYPSGGVAMTQLLRKENSGSAVVEYDALHPVWTQSNTSATFSVASFRWIVLALGTSGSPILAAHDLGSTQSISNDYLALSVTESSYSAGVYPILRFKRTLA